MMKRWLCVLMVLALTLSPVLAGAEDEIAAVAPVEPDLQWAEPQVEESYTGERRTFVQKAVTTTIEDERTPLGIVTSNTIGLPDHTHGTQTTNNDPVVTDDVIPDITPVPVAEPVIDPETGIAAEPEAEVQPVEEVAEDPAPVYNLDLTQFILNTNYGLFWLRDGGLVNLNGATLTVGKGYALAMRLLIDRPVLAGAAYTYYLPAILTGNGGAAEQTFSSPDGLFATAGLSGNRLTVVFTELAQEITQDGSATFELQYKFNEKLNEVVAAEYTGFRVELPTAYGLQVAEFGIDREEAETEEAAPLPEGEPTMKPEARIMPETEPEAEATEAVADEVVTVPVQEAEESEQVEAHESGTDEAASDVEKQVIVHFEMASVVADGDPVSVCAELIGYEGEPNMQWQYNNGSGWKNAPGDSHGLVYHTTVSREAMNSYWRLLVEETAPTATEGEITK